MTIIPPGYAQFIMPITRQSDPDPYVVTWACQPNFDGYPTQQNYVNDIQTSFVSFWGSSFPDNCVLGPCTMRLGQDGPDPVVIIAATTNTGSAAADFLPQNTAVLVQKRSSLGGRRNRGRMYMPIATEATVSEVGQLTTTALASYQTVASNWLNSFNDEVDGYGQMVILHSTAPADPTPVTALTISPVVATQRRRLRR